VENAIPSHLKYTKEHEWAQIDGDVVTVGITHHAQCQLGDVVYLELPNVGKTLTRDKNFGVVESVKAVSDLFAPISGEVVEVNQTLVQTPEAINQDPYGQAWMVKLRLSDPKDLESLMDNQAYSQYLKEHAK
jgi:glycine cleavage system H protein